MSFFRDWTLIKHPVTGKSIKVFKNYRKQISHEQTSGITLSGWWEKEDEKTRGT